MLVDEGVGAMCNRINHSVLCAIHFVCLVVAAARLVHDPSLIKFLLTVVEDFPTVTPKTQYGFASNGSNPR